MILSPFDLALLAPVAALLPARFQEHPVALHNDFARRLAGAGFYGPFRVRTGDTVIEDRGGHPMVGVLPVVGLASAREAAVIAAAALNQLCGFETAEAQTGPMADAAE